MVEAAVDGAVDGAVVDGVVAGVVAGVVDGVVAGVAVDTGQESDPVEQDLAVAPLIPLRSNTDAFLGPTSSKPNGGGSTKLGSGTPTLSSGRYLGGSRVPYTSGHKSPSGIVPFFM